MGGGIAGSHASGIRILPTPIPPEEVLYPPPGVESIVRSKTKTSKFLVTDYSDDIC